MTTTPARPWKCPALSQLRRERVVTSTVRAIVVAMMLVSVACVSATAAGFRKQTSESVFKGHRLATFLDEGMRRATVELDDHEIIAKDSVAEIGKINYVDLGTSIVYFLHAKTVAGCGSFIFVHVFLAADPGKSEVLTDFGGCNDQLVMKSEQRQGWAAWYAIAYRDDRATAQVAFIRDEKFTTKEVKAPPCLFVPGANANADCVPSLLAEATGSGELGLPTGTGAFADRKIATFLNRSTGKATLELNGRVFRTFDDAKEFYLASVEGQDQFGLFVFFLRQGAGCSTRPLVFFAKPASEPEVIMDYAPCSDRMVRLTQRKGNAIEWSGVAFHFGEPRGYIASVIDHKVSTRSTLLPACMMEADKANTNICVRQALGEPAPSQPPQLRVIPAPQRASPKAPRTLGI